MATLGFFDWAICAGYLGIVLLLGLWFANQQKTTEDFFLGGRRMHWIPIGLSLFAGTFSSLSFVGLPSEAAYKDYHLYLAILFIPLVVSPIVAVVFLPIFFRLRVTSAYEYVERRFDRRLRLVCSVLFMLYTIGWMGNLLRAVGVILEAIFALSPWQTAALLVAVGLFATAYTVIGGVKAVVWTDALQAFALGGGMLVVLILALGRVEGGFQSVLTIGAQHDRFAMFDTTFDLKSGNFYAACAFGLFVYLTGHAVSFTAVQRFVSMPSLRAARWSLVVNGVMVGGVCLLFFFVGSTLFAFYHQQGEAARAKAPVPARGDSAVAAAAKSAPAPPLTLYEELDQSRKQDQLLPRFVMNEIPAPGLLGLLLAGLFAAAMSSVDSGINSMTASVACDWRTGKELDLKSSKYLCLLFGLASVGMAVVFYYMGGNVFPLIMKIAGMFFGLMLAVFLLGMLSRRTNTGGVLIGVAAGIVALTVALLSPISDWWFGAATCLPTLLVGWLASYAFAPPPPETIRGLVIGTADVEKS